MISDYLFLHIPSETVGETISNNVMLLCPFPEMTAAIDPLAPQYLYSAFQRTGSGNVCLECTE